MIRIHGAKLDNEAAWLASWAKMLARPEAGFARLTTASYWGAVRIRAEALGAVQTLVVLGIGGSSLGTQVLAQAFPSRVRMEFLDSPDPLAWSFIQSRLSGAVHFLIVSKSGGTLETLIWVERLAAAGLLKPDNCTVVASPGEGPLHAWARREKIAQLEIPADVGGRFSVLSAVGMLPAAVMGLDVEEFRAGAAWALERPRLAAELAAVSAAAWKREQWITQLWSFSVGLNAFGEWWQQLWAESLAKRLDRAGGAAPRVSSPMACTGPRDQHSVLQQLIEGARDKFVFVTRVRASERDGEVFRSRLFADMPFSGRDVSLGQVLGAEAEGFERALRDSGISYAGVELESLTPRSLGALFMLWQMAVALLGEHLGLNPFDQPGVELGKKHAAEILRA